MLRFLIILILLALITGGLVRLIAYFLKKRLLQAFSPPPSAKPLDEKLVCCETCHLFIPLSKAIHENDRYYCCDQHIPLP